MMFWTSEVFLRPQNEKDLLSPPWAFPDASQHSRNRKGGGKPQHSEGLRQEKPTSSSSSEIPLLPNLWPGPFRLPDFATDIQSTP